MTLRARRAVAASLGVFLIAGPVFAQGRRSRGGGDEGERRPPVWLGRASLSGKIVDETGKGVPDAKVTLVYGPANAGFFVMTKKSGEFSAKDLKTGEWRVQVEAPNFPTFRQTVQVADKNPPVEWQLKHDNSPELIAAAEALFKSGKYAEARTEYMKVLTAHPELTGINRAIAFTYGREGNHAEALKYLDLAMANNPDDPLLLQLAAASAIEVKDYPRAMAYLAKIDDTTMSDPDVLVNAAINLINKQQSASAIKLLDRVVARFPLAPDPYFYRGFARLQADNAAEGKADLQKYVSLAPADAPQMAQAKELLARIK
jgi:predicted Zn-dependent protease